MERSCALEDRTTTKNVHALVKMISSWKDMFAKLVVYAVNNRVIIIIFVYAL